MAIQTRYIYLLRNTLPVIDITMVNIVYYTAFYLTSDLGKSVSHEINERYLVVCNLLWLLCTVLCQLYSDQGTRRLETIYRATWRSVILHFMLFTFYLLFSRDIGFSRTFLLVFYGLLACAFVLNRFVGTSFQYLLFKRFNVTKKVAVMGSNETAMNLSLYLQHENTLDFHGFVGDEDNIYSENEGISHDVFCRKLAEAVASGVNEIYVSITPQRMKNVKALIAEADKQCVRLKFIPDLGGSLPYPYRLSYLANQFPILTLRHDPMEDLGNRFRKRVFDVIFSALVIVFILSWLYPLIALLIKLQSKGPVLFKQIRSGRDDEPFCCYKFRSMRVNEDSHQKQATKDDDRITPVGKFLRKTSLDEMPQFFNVFLGDMSVVGPRPHMLKHTEEYAAIIDQYMVRHFLKPGITGWAQVNGCRGETRQKSDMEKRVGYDIYYLENWTGMLDVKIIYMTMINLIKGDDHAY